MRNQKGITLVALVITIIVLLILAGVSISLVVGQNGVLGRASDAVITNKVAGVKEKVSSALAAAEIEYQGKWAQGISSGTTTTRTTVYDGTTGEHATEGAVLKDLKSSYGNDNVVVSGTLVSTTNAKIVIKSGSDIFEFQVKVDGTTGTSTIDKTVKYYENATMTSAGVVTPDSSKPAKDIVLN